MDDIDDALSYAKYNFQGTIAGFRVQREELLKKHKQQEDKKPKEYKYLKLFATHYVSDEIKSQACANNYTHAIIWVEEFLSLMAYECKQKNFENFRSKEQIPVKKLLTEACDVLSNETLDTYVICKPHLNKKNSAAYYDIILKY